jgi:hypothetical protein
LSGTTDSLHFAFAGMADEADLRRLLRENPMDGAVRIGFAHEPDYFQGTALTGAEDRTLLARENNRLVAAGRCIIQPRWLNGEVRRCAYLGELRLDASVRGRSDILRRGYAFFATEYARDPADFCFTSVVTDNLRARRMLEHGVRGLPRYEPLTDFTTLLLRAKALAKSPPLPAGLQLVAGDAVSVAQLVELLNSHGRSRNLSTYWTVQRFNSLMAHGLRAQDFLILRDAETLVGCIAVWDQRKFRQIVVHGYHPLLSTVRPLANLAGSLFSWPHLPPAGSILAHAFLSPLIIKPRFAHALPRLVSAGVNEAARRRLSCVALGFASNDPLWQEVGHTYRGRRYISRLYTVHWPGVISGVSKLDAKPCLPELALL